MPALSIGQFVTFRPKAGPVYCGHVVSFDAKTVALSAVQRLVDQGDPLFHTSPIVFVERDAVRPVDPVN